MEKTNRDLGHRILSLLRNFWVNLLAVALGVIIGVFAKDTAQELVPIGNLYLKLLSMTVLPIVFSAIAHSLGQLLRSGTARNCIVRLVVVFSIAVLLGSITGTVGGLIGNPGGGLGGRQHDMLGKILLHSPDGATSQGDHATGVGDFVVGMVPRNIFKAFSEGKSLAVIFVSILMGIALGVNRSDPSGRLLEVVRGVYETFLKILNWALYALPFGLCCLVAGQIVMLGTQYLVTLSELVGIFYLCCGVMCAIYLLVIRLVTGRSTSTILKAFRDPLGLAFVASNSLVAMPMALQHLEDDLNQPRDVVELVVPLGLVMNRHAYPLLFALMAVFVSQIYHHPLSFAQLVQVSFAAALTGMAAIGPAASVAPMMGLILAPLGLPAGLAVATLVETSSIVTPMVAMMHLFGSSATATLIGAKGTATEYPASSPVHGPRDDLEISESRILGTRGG
ncbi:MAG: cation:dicarboxylase symporter family transporter [Deltaproteobacteria bacterium]